MYKQEQSERQNSSMFKLAIYGVACSLRDPSIRERSSVLYLGMAKECWDFAKLAIA